MTEGSAIPDDATPGGAAEPAACAAGCCKADATVVPSGRGHAASAVNSVDVGVLVTGRTL